MTDQINSQLLELVAYVTGTILFIWFIFIPFVPWLLAIPQLWFCYGPKEGQSITIVQKGNSPYKGQNKQEALASRAAVFYAAKVNGYAINRETGQYKKLSPEEYKAYRKTLPWLERKHGIIFMGGGPFLRQVRQFHVARNKRNPTVGRELECLRVETIDDFLLFRDEEFIVLSDMDTLGTDNMYSQVKVKFLVYYEIDNAEKAQYKVPNFREKMTAAFRAANRDYIAGETFWQLVGGKHEMGKTSYINNLRDTVNDKTNDGNGSLVEECGIRIVDIHFLEVKPDGEEQLALTKAYQANALADAAGKKKVTDATYDAKAVVIDAEGQANARRLILAADNTAQEPALILARERAVEKTGLQTLVQSGSGTSVLVPVGGVKKGGL